MSEGTPAGTGWFEGVEQGDLDGARDAIETGSAESPADWPARAVETGFVDTDEEYYAALREATIATARDAAAERERADDRQVIHAVRAMDDTERMANELAERVAEWAASRTEDAGTGIEHCRELVDRRGENAEPADDRVAAIAERVVDLDEEAAELEAYVERTVRSVAPNLAALAGPTLAARLLALAGGLESLARTSSSTMQVLGAEDALFAHLRGSAPSPKHGVIYTHEYVRHTHPDERGSAARALAGKLTIAARVDHYAGDRRPDLDRELDERIARIRARRDDEDADDRGDDDAS
ncbi:NOP5/NOP56 family protein [Halococcus saccharolyticus]|uniref:Pre-mRNA processing ribonucleoprotein, binding domain-containing protein n=1 Tax=Halococcus saccharolyticus DSM 5350 TaxID=1227455 RepID=M0MT46_9EURY|nr:Pre-mRNA processing ribonucleoprotein,-binding domain-containing protein [Halococcus saccharolyticus]EMA47919.1 Pre-mRNA processing ribonucleoprotein, binding domain-containing protein [Halococcus saccharolyticus DSM 5350]